MKPPSANDDLTLLALSIVAPVDYLTGVGAPRGPLPGSILSFTRSRRTELSLSHEHTQHHRCVLVTALRGSGVICVDADNVWLREGESLLIFPFQFHSYMNLELEKLCFNFVTFEMASPSELEPLEPLRAAPRSLGPMEAALLREVLHAWKNDPHQSLLPFHLGLLLRRLAASKSLEKRPVIKNLGADLFARVNQYVQPRLAQPITLAELGRALGQSESHLRARFRALTGISLGSHLRALRIQKACNLLHSTALPIGTVAEQCGFESVYSFSRTFKIARGISPRAYRQGLLRSP